MPGGDRTGPRGEGPMTGRGMGYLLVWARAEDLAAVEVLRAQFPQTLRL